MIDIRFLDNLHAHYDARVTIQLDEYGPEITLTGEEWERIRELAEHGLMIEQQKVNPDETV